MCPLSVMQLEQMTKAESCVLVQTAQAVEPLMAPTPGMQGLLKAFGCDPGSTSLRWRLRQLRPGFEAVFAPLPAALAGSARVVTNVHLATLGASATPRMAFAASQVWNCDCLLLGLSLQAQLSLCREITGMKSSPWHAHLLQHHLHDSHRYSDLPAGGGGGSHAVSGVRAGSARRPAAPPGGQNSGWPGA